MNERPKELQRFKEPRASNQAFGELDTSFGFTIHRCVRIRHGYVNTLMFVPIQKLFGLRTEDLKIERGGVINQVTESRLSAKALSMSPVKTKV